MKTDYSNPIRNKLDLASVSKPALVGAAALVVMVAVLAGRMLIDTATANDFEIASASESATLPDASGEAAGSEPASADLADGERAELSGDGATQGRERIYVHVSGSVNEPGLVEVPAGARVAEAVQAAGGFTGDAQADSVNLARMLQDGEQIRVLSRDEAQAAAGGADAGAAASASQAEAAGGTAQGLVNINTATAAQLESLPGIGPSTAQKIVSNREEQGPFSSTDDLKRVSGIGDKKFEALSRLICV